MVKTVTISDEAYAVLHAHASANDETLDYAMNELFDCAPHAWEMNVPEMKKVWAKFKASQR